ncbi:MAG: beta-lactamase family protein [Bacteroidales bacterium]|nr:beta-lactamase family protein [Bacteroidales bacterium]
MKPIVLNIAVAFCAFVMSSCSIVRGLTTDGKNGPDIFSFEKREVDTIANGGQPFVFPVGKRADWIDTTYFSNEPHRCEFMTYREAFNKESSTQGLLIIHNDSIVYEQYWGDFTADRMATIFSISKSITSLMCGIAVDDGYIRSIDDPVTDYLPELKNKDPRWQRLTIRHLLDMRSGLDFDDTYDLNWKELRYLNAMARLNYGHNIQKQIQGLKFRCEPGTKHRYESMTAAILGVVIERASGKRYADYLSERVWVPLGMEHPALINIDSRKHDNAHTFGGISTTIKDLAKIGRLYLNNGVWNGKRIVSEDWIRQTADCDSSLHGYHFNWYNINYEDFIRPEQSGYYALGICEQVLYVNPYKNFVMVRIGLQNNGYTCIPVLFEQLSYWWK